MALPQKWCIQRTAANGAEINGYFNRLHNKPNGYEKRSGWMTNDTKAGEKGPFNEKPKGYTEITFAQFTAELLNKEAGRPAPIAVVAPAAPDNLPKDWITKGDNSEAMLKVAKLISDRFNVKWTGKSLGYYGMVDGVPTARYGKENFANNAIEYTPEEILAELEDMPAAQPAAPQAAPVRRANPNVIIPEAGVEQVLCNYMIAKAWPGSQPIGAFVQTGMAAVALNNAMYQNAEYFTPVMRRLFAQGNIVAVRDNNPRAMNGVYEVISAAYNARNFQYVFRLRDRIGGIVTDVLHSVIYEPTPQEVAGFQALLINGHQVVAEKHINMVRIGVTQYSLQTIRNLKNVKDADIPNDVTINLRGCGNLTGAQINQIVELFA